jgi:hypothetical protein
MLNKPLWLICFARVLDCCQRVTILEKGSAYELEHKSTILCQMDFLNLNLKILDLLEPLAGNSFCSDLQLFDESCKWRVSILDILWLVGLNSAPE